MGHVSKVTSKGQVTLPAGLRHELDIAPGDRIRYINLQDGGYRIEKVRDSFEDLRGIIKLDRAISGEEIDRWIAERRGRE